MKFDWFVLPFSAGLLFVLGYISIKFFLWIKSLSNTEKADLRNYFFSRNVFSSINEIFFESLLHRKLFRKNPLLGYMHMSLAFGWLSLIVLGNIEIKFFSEYTINFPYVPIFLRYFEPNPSPHFFGKGSNFLMDFLLLMILSGVLLAIIKRFRPSTFGMTKVTKHNKIDKIALTALWFIFPLRLLAESFTSGIYGNGHFLTGSLGRLFASFLQVEYLAYPTWWAYSFALGAFFFALPFSRYMHIPAEALLIVFRNAGIKAQVVVNAFAQVEIRSCSRCGVCIDTCQLSQEGINHIQPSYFIREVRYNNLKKETTDNCLMCGRCNISCPVGIETTQLRLAKRIERNNIISSNYSYIEPNNIAKTKVLYFAGCMTHLTPGIKIAMTKILNNTGVSWQFLDKDGSICCGRPLMLAGQIDAANELAAKNKKMIISSGATTLVTSCPICYKVFKDNYDLGITVLHHSQYIQHLIESEQIKIDRVNKNVIYHDPCELGRNSGIYNEPRETISHVANLMFNENAYENSLCCGNSMANTILSNSQKNEIASKALVKMGISSADMLITGCPLCKKSFERVTEKPVKDIAQLVADNIISIDKKKKQAMVLEEEMLRV
jgi:Fe-S oxidoreductase